MSDSAPVRATPPPAVRASDAERDHTVALLQCHFADGRITQDELEERVTAAYAAQYREQLSGLLADLPADAPAPAPATLATLVQGPDPLLLCLLLWLCPPAGVAYWLISRRGRQA